MPDHMATDEGRARELAPLHTSRDDTSYWVNNLFYRGKKEVWARQGASPQGSHHT